MKNPLKTLEANTIGRDFVIGDLHGSYSVFENLLKGINFNPTKDRIISVGDMVDRGPDSLKCLELIREPWFHTVLANHEQMMSDKFSDGWSGAYWFQNGGFWGAEAYNCFKAMKNPESHMIPTDAAMHLIDLIPLVDELPFLITVNTKSGKKFHVLHAELPSGVGKITDMELSVPEEVLLLATTQRGDGDAFVWSRNLFYNFYNTDLSNRDKVIRTVSYVGATKIFNDELSHVISGHTILQKPMTIVGQTNIDTGAYHSYWIPAEPYSHNGIAPKSWAALTCVELDTWKFFQATSDSFKEIEPFVVSKEDLAALKSEY